MAIIRKAKSTSKGSKARAKAPYTLCEWKKIEKLACVKCELHKSPKKAKNHIETL
jgi:hypothetical protein